MDRTAVLLVFLGALATFAAAFWAHSRWAGPGERVGPVSMAAFVVGWLALITAAITGVFLLTLLVS